MSANGAGKARKPSKGSEANDASKADRASGASTSFEESLEQLEAIVNELEKGEFSLEESLQKFEEGLKLGKSCKEMLEKAEARIKKLVEDQAGTLSEEDAPGDV